MSGPTQEGPTLEALRELYTEAFPVSEVLGTHAPVILPPVADAQDMLSGLSAFVKRVADREEEHEDTTYALRRRVEDLETDLEEARDALRDALEASADKDG